MSESAGIEIDRVGYQYGSRTALNDVTFSVPAGAFCALLGPNGAGKTTLFGLLTRLFTTTNGTLSVAGHDVAKSPRAALAKMGVVFQQTTLDLDLSVRWNLRYFASLHGMSGRDADRRIEKALDRLDMRDRDRERCRDLNGGHRRRVEIARALVHDPQVLLLDEPTVGLDAATRASITRHVHQRCAQDGLTVLWATHLVDEVLPDDRLVILHRGRVKADGTAGDITEGRDLTDVFLAMTEAPAA